jgi:hypothetical protein
MFIYLIIIVILFNIAHYIYIYCNIFMLMTLFVIIILVCFDNIHWLILFIINL